MNKTNTFGTRLIELRKKKNITQEELSLKFSVTRSAVGNWERGAVPREPILSGLADLFEVSVDYLLGRVDKPEIMLFTPYAKDESNIIFRMRLYDLLKERFFPWEKSDFDLSLKKGTCEAFINGKDLPDYSLLQKMAEYFGVSIDFLIGNKNLIDNPDGSLSYSFHERDNKTAQGYFNYSFGFYPLQDIAFIPTFLYLEEGEGNLLEDIIVKNDQIKFMALVAFLNEKLHLGYCMSRAKNGISRISLVINNANTIDPLNPVPYHGYKELKANLEGHVQIEELHYAFFLPKYLELTADKKVSLMQDFVSERAKLLDITKDESESIIKKFFKGKTK